MQIQPCGYGSHLDREAWLVSAEVAIRFIHSFTPLSHHVPTSGVDRMTAGELLASCQVSTAQKTSNSISFCTEEYLLLPIEWTVQFQNEGGAEREMKVSQVCLSRSVRARRKLAAQE